MKKCITTRLIHAAEQAIIAHNMIGENDAVLIGVSGGPDSMALLHALQALSSRYHLRLGVAHLNHGLRQNAAESDEAFVRQTASAMGLPYFMEKADVHAIRNARRLSVEEAARKVRLRFLGEVAQAHGFSAVALGHHADDNAELVLMNLLRGSGPLGLTGIPPKRPLQADGPPGGNLQLIRPLIGIRRQDIEAYLAENNIPSVTDKTNSDLRYRRNRIRCELLPLLRQRYNPNIVDTLNRMADILRAEQEWAGGIQALDFEAAVLTQTDREIALSVPELHRAHPAVQRGILREAIRKVKGDLRRISLGHIDAVITLAGRGDASGSLDLPNRIRVTATPQQLVVTRENQSLREIGSRKSSAPTPFQYRLDAPGTLLIPELAITIIASMLPNETCPDVCNAGHRTAFFDMEAISFPLTVRNLNPGDRFTPLGMSGRQKIKKYFIDNKIPASQRASCPVLESRGRLVWLMGYRIDDSVKISADTRKVLKVEFGLA